MAITKKKIYSLLITLSGAVGIAASYHWGQASAHEIFAVERIAHAGGALNGLTYTNSIEAIEQNWNKGFYYFEIDLSFTRDGHIVCAHNWNNDGGHIHWKGLAPSLAEFQTRTQKDLDHTRCTLSTLHTWFSQHKKAKLITDIKGDNIKALAKISHNYPDFVKQIIPQIYSPNHSFAVRKLGYQQLIWSLYRHERSQSEILDWITTLTQPFAITMPEQTAYSDLPTILHNKNIRSYVHTINNPRQLEELQNKKRISEIYTDVLSPPKRSI